MIAYLHYNKKRLIFMLKIVLVKIFVLNFLIEIELI